ncbi:MAG: hypothetical protein MUO31_04095 [Thermodesulfovibrionales bacterium]|nr:hypothetical protein [Thermodesulfovibrionales bacterium]
MSDYERSAEAFSKLISDFGLSPDPTYNEADTRAKIIDQILKECLGWSDRGHIMSREEHVHEGFLDYRLRTSKDGLILEAKRIGQTFSLPTGLSFKSRISVKNLFQRQVELREMYDQVATYAHECGVQFCALSNGTQWLIFPGVRTDQIHIRKSRIIIFNGFKEIEENFVDFFNLLSFKAVEKGSLSRCLLDPIERIEPTFVFNSENRRNVPYDRNPLSLVLVDLLPKYFGDLHGEPCETDMLKECFVSDSPVRDSLDQYTVSGQDERPSKTLTAISPVLHFYSLSQVADKLNAQISSFLSAKRDKHIQIMVGRVGIGKTTFLNHFFCVDRQEFINNEIVLLLDFRNITDGTDLNRYFNDFVWDLLSKHPRFESLTSEKALHDIYSEEIAMLDRGPLATLKRNKSPKYEEEIASYLRQEFQEKDRFYFKLARHLYIKKIARFIIVFDNVDQLSINLQEKVIQFAYSKMSDFHAFMLISMWEETYYSSKRTGRTLSTIRTVPMQIARQSTSAVIIKRLNYFIKQVRANVEPLTLLDESICDRETFCRFLELILRSLLLRNREVRLFLELLALGNIRASLEMFYAFLTAGSLDTTKIISKMKENDEYLVPVHEFIKSVMLGSKRYYSEMASPILNVFAIGDVESPSHFTRFRIMQWLYERRHEATPFGNGFMTIPRIMEYGEKIGISKKDANTSLKRLLENSVVENDLRAYKLLDGAQAIRITPTGRYYLTGLCLRFAYIDLVIQDTPFLDEQTFRSISSKCESVDMEIRFQRCEEFLNYLKDQENEELNTLEKLSGDVTWREQFIPRIQNCFNREKDRVIRKNVLIK